MTTKKMMLVWMLVASCSMLSFAQNQDRWSIGPRAGVNLANVTHVEESQSISGAVFGITSTYSFSEHTGLTLEALYSVEGYKAPFTSYKLRYLEVPVMFDYFFGELGQRFRPKVYVGISPSFYLSGTLNELDVQNDYWRHFNGNLVGGVGFNWRMANRIWLNTDVRSFIGLSDIRDQDFLEGESIKSRMVQLSLGLCYGLSKLQTK